MNFQITLKSTETWPGAGNGLITIKNLGPKVSNWSLNLTTNIVITNFWELGKEGQGTTITVKPPEWHLDLNENETIQSGFSYQGTENIVWSLGDVVITPVIKELNFTVHLKSTQQWPEGGNGIITITNNGPTVSHWSFELIPKFMIQSFWQLSGKNIVTPAAWKPTIQAGETIESGFSYLGNEFVVSSPTKGIKLTFTPISSGPVTPPTEPVTPPTELVTPPTEPITPPTEPVTPPTEPVTPPTKKRVIGYYSEWCIYDRQFNVSMIPNQLTHVFYAFMLPNPSQADFDLLAKNYPFPPKPYHPEIPEGTLVYHDEYAGQLNIAALKQLKLQHPHLKVLISIGGWTLSYTLSKIFADNTLRTRFVKSAAQFIVNHGLDGLDCDWEYPSKQGIGFNYVREDDTENLIQFLTELRAEFDLSPRHLEITAAVGTSPEVIEKYRGTASHFDFIMAMTYDYAGSFGDGGHLAALYHNPEGDMNSAFNVHAAITHLLEIFPADKIVLGLPLYGRGWAKIVPNHLENPIYGKSVSGPAVSLSGAAGEPGLSSWRHIQLQKNYKEYNDYGAHAVYMRNDLGETWTYDNPDTIREKVRYMKDKGLGGIGYWELSDNTRDGIDDLIAISVGEL